METKKLTCYDLMVGDYVMAKNEPIRIATPIGDETALHQLTIYGYTSDGAKAGPFLETELSAIPLTAEVLEKLGFSELMEHNEWTRIFRKYIDDLIIEVGTYEPMFINIGYLDSDGEEENLSSIVKVKGENLYFHDLQHALRLCGINDKEIEL